jgi:predicted TIM-barrel fold metal-dependent hydrolase
MSQADATQPEIRLSADSHVSEPPDLWEREMPAKFKDRALRFPRVEYGTFNHARPGGWDPRERLKDMAADGISGEVLYPTLAKATFEQFHGQPLDLELAKATERVYNDWMIEYCSEAPERLWGQALIGLWDIDYAIHEMERAKQSGLKGVATWVAPPDELPWTGDHYERFWSAAEEMAMPIGMHINSGFGAYVARHDEDQFATLARQAYGHKVVAMKAMAEMILSGVFERHPRLTVVLTEFECGWIPFFLEDLDRKLGRRRGLEIKKLPSEYFSQNVYSSFMQDGVAGLLLERWGQDNFVFSNDYPHAGGIWPHTDETVELTLGHLSPEVRRKVLGENLARAYGQPLPTPIARQTTDFDDNIWQRPWLKKTEEFTFDKPKMGLAM